MNSFEFDGSDLIEYRTVRINPLLRLTSVAGCSSILTVMNLSSLATA